MSAPKKIRLCFIEEIPPEIIEKILEKLNLNEVIQAKLVCRRWKSIIGCESFFDKIFGKNNII